MQPETERAVGEPSLLGVGFSAAAPAATPTVAQTAPTTTRALPPWLRLLRCDTGRRTACNRRPAAAHHRRVEFAGFGAAHGDDPLVTVPVPLAALHLAPAGQPTRLHFAPA